MNASPKTLWNLLSAKRRFRIPLYQRRYGWQYEHCAALWNDLARVYENPGESHYLGCLVVTATDSDGFQSIVDGQQRLTSLTLLLRSIADALPPQEEEMLLSRLRDAQGGWWLMPQHWGEGSDLERFEHAMRQGAPEDGDPFGRNLRDFRMAIADRPGVLTLDGVQDALNRIILSLVELEKAGPDDDDQALIFEKMNAEGLKLEPHDLIRNRVFLLAAEAAPPGDAAIASQRQRDLFRNEWLHLEHLFDRRNLSEMSHFFRDYLILKTGEDDIHAGRGLPERFKKFLDGCPLNSTEAVECLVNDLWRYAAAWCRVVQGRNFTGADNATRRLNAALREFSLIANASVLALATRLILAVSSQRAQREKIARALESLARFIAVSSLTGQNTRRLPPELADKADDAATFSEELCRYWPDGFDWKLSLRQTLIDGEADIDEQSSAGVNDLEQSCDLDVPAEDALEESESQAVDVYHLDRRAMLFLLLRINEELMEKTGDTPMAFTEHGHSFEHIMPQTPDGEWRQVEPFHKTYLHTLGNLTLVGKDYNSSISNHPLAEKLPYYENSSYALTRKIAHEIPKALSGEGGVLGVMKLPAYFDRRAGELVAQGIALLNPHRP